MTAPTISRHEPPSIVPPDWRHPQSLLPSCRSLDFVCPLCRGDLAVANDAYVCPGCARTYPLHGGIPDFRVFPDPFLSVDEDHDRAERILAVLEQHSLPSLLDFYWSLSDITPQHLRPRYVQSALRGEMRARRIWRLIADSHSQQTEPRRILEIGSGTGDFLAAAAEAGESVVGIDIAMRWLHVSRRRLLDRALPVPPLVCCCAEFLPFRDARFDVITSTATLEFTRSPELALAEAARVLRQDGSMFLNTANRHSLARDPYVHLWGVGLLSRRWQSRYVRWRSGACYDHTRTLSTGEIKRLARRHFRRITIAPADVDDNMVQHLPRPMRLAASAYRAARNWPIGRAILTRITPQWDLRLDAPVPLPKCEPLIPLHTECRTTLQPHISVVIASVSGWPALMECLESLERQYAAPAAEIIVADRTGDETRAAIHRRFPAVRVLAADPDASIPQLRAAGIARARGRVVALTEDHCLPSPDWLRTIAAAHRSGYSAVGGLIENATMDRFVDRAAFLCEYARFVEPPTSSDYDPPGNNVAYDRRLLDRFAADWKFEYRETDLHRRMREHGIEFRCEPQMHVRHSQSLGFRQALAQRFHYSRVFAAHRIRDWPGPGRLAYAVLTPLLVPLLFSRLTRLAIASRNSRREAIGLLPILSALYVAWAVGEAVGALFGPGRSAERLV